MTCRYTTPDSARTPCFIALDSLWINLFCIRSQQQGPLPCHVQGSFHCAQMQHAGMQLLSEPLPGTSTGTVIVLTTPDANRTFLSYLGSSQTLTLSAAAKAAISRTRVLIVEGYLWEMPGAKEAIGSAVRLARESGALVALTTGDPGLVARHRSEFWRLLKNGDVDVLFANRCDLLLNETFVPPAGF
jgi:sugar/nucleoside kinase (ribokinase family)